MSTVYLYNPLHDITLKYDGREWPIPKGISKMEDQTFEGEDQYRRHHPSAPEKNAMHKVVMGGKEFATMLLRRQYVDMFDAGFLVSETKITPEQIQVADIKCRGWKIKEIDHAMQERDERRAGGKGRLTLDDHMIEWMVELGVEDKLYNPQPRQPAMDVGAIAALTAATKALEQTLAKK